MLSAIFSIPSTLQVQAQPYPDLLKHMLTRHVNNAHQKTDRWSAAEPCSGWMKPKPLVELNHLTVPVAMVDSLSGVARARHVEGIKSLREETHGWGAGKRKAWSNVDSLQMGLGGVAYKL